MITLSDNIIKEEFTDYSNVETIRVADVKHFIRLLKDDVNNLGKEVKNILDGDEGSYVSKETLAINTILSFYLKIQNRAGDALCTKDEEVKG